MSYCPAVLDTAWHKADPVGDTRRCLCSSRGHSCPQSPRIIRSLQMDTFIQQTFIPAHMGVEI